MIREEPPLFPPSTQPSQRSPSLPKNFEKVLVGVVKHHQIALFPTSVRLIQAIIGYTTTSTEFPSLSKPNSSKEIPLENLAVVRK